MAEQISEFLTTPPGVAASQLALVANPATVGAWALVAGPMSRSKISMKRGGALPELDRLEAIEIETGRIPTGMTAEQYLRPLIHLFIGFQRHLSSCVRRQSLSRILICSA